MTSLRVSIVTVCYNAADTLQDTLDSVAAQVRGKNEFEIEHIVIDGNSQDGTSAILERNRDALARVVSEPDHGLYDAMNKGIALATGDIVGTLNADDIYQDETALATVVECFMSRDIDAMYADLVYVDRDNLDKVVRYWTSVPYRSGLFERGWIPAHPTFFVRRGVYEQYGLFDLQYKIQADFELCLRLLAVHGIRSHYVNKLLVRMRMGGVTNNSVGNILRGGLESYRACQQHGLKVNVLFFVRKWLSRLPQFFTKPKGVS